MTPAPSSRFNVVRVSGSESSKRLKDFDYGVLLLYKLCTSISRCSTWLNSTQLICSAQSVAPVVYGHRFAGLKVGLYLLHLQHLLLILFQILQLQLLLLSYATPI